LILTIGGFLMRRMTLICLIIVFIPYHFIKAEQINERNQALETQLNQLVERDPNLEGAIAGISIRAADSGELLYNHLGDLRLRPASNLKLLTAAVALSVLGEDYRFSTEVRTDGSLKGRTLSGNLYVKGKGDPTLLKADIDEIAKKLRSKGVLKIDGDIIADDSYYDHIRYSHDLPWSDETTYYGGQVSALTVSPDKDYDSGTVLIEVRPGKEIGQESVITIQPQTNYVKVINNSVTVSPEGTKEVKMEREHGTNTIRIEGTIPMKAKLDREWVSVWEPTRLVLDLFQQSLAQQGIKWTGKITTGEAPVNSNLLISHPSMPISKLLVPFMKLSNNGHAETLIKEMGKVVKGEGSWEKGLGVVQEQLEKIGVNPTTVVMRDGSGISHVDLIPANELTSLLYEIQDEPWFPSYLASLPISGEKGKFNGGTLRNRMRDEEVKGKVRAKTGTISTVSSLSGYIETKSGETIIFSIILNNLIDETKGKEIEDKIVSILANQ
jgi:serine-type D-Ala-D-Ala carboxypeptidase/endopeptidase (penicillin-binding protein 4)